MDKMDVRVLTQNQKVLLNNMAVFKPWKSGEPTDRFSADRRRVRITSDGDTHATASLEPGSQEAVACASGTDVGAEGEQAAEQSLMENLLSDVPPEMLAAARQILKGQMKSKTEPRKGLDFIKRPEGTEALLTAPEIYAQVSTDICEDASPHPIQDFADGSERNWESLPAYA